MSRRIIAVCILYCMQSFSYDYDLVVIGAGAAGIRAAMIAHDMGKRVAIIDKAKMGNGRLIYGDVPYRILFDVAKNVHNAHALASAHLISDYNNAIQDEQLFSYIASICNDVEDLIQQKLSQKKNIKSICGYAQFVNDHTIMVDNHRITSEHFFIATGARPHIPDIEGLQSVPYITQSSFFKMKKLPKSIIILGGGSFSLELGAALNELGVDVTLLKRQAVLLPTFDYEMDEYFTSLLMHQGMHIVCSCQPVRVFKKDNGISVTVRNRAEKETTYTAECLFVAMGIMPNVENLALEKAGVVVRTDTQNHAIQYGKVPIKSAIKVNPFLQTTTPNIYAGGDVIGCYAVVRPAIYQASLAVYNMFNPHDRKMVNYTNELKYIGAPSIEFASMGLTEQDAIKNYPNDFVVYRQDYLSSEQAYIENNRSGIIKCICSKRGILLGAHVLGKCASEVLNQLHIGQQINIINGGNLKGLYHYQDMLYEIAFQCAVDAKNNTNDRATFIEKMFGWWQGA